MTEKQLTGNDRVIVASLGVVEEEDQSDVETVRLAMLVHGQNPLDAMAVKNNLKKPLKEYRAFIQPYLDQLTATTEYDADGGAVITQEVPATEDTEAKTFTVNIRPILGRDWRRFRIQRPEQLLDLMPEFTGMTVEDLKALPVGAHTAVTVAMAFLAGLLEE